MGEENPLAEHVKSGAAEHLTPEHPDPVDMAFDGPGVPGQGESGGDSFEVAVNADGEDMEAGKVGLSDGVQPVR